MRRVSGVRLIVARSSAASRPNRALQLPASVLCRWSCDAVSVAPCRSAQAGLGRYRPFRLACPHTWPAAMARAPWTWTLTSSSTAFDLLFDGQFMNVLYGSLGAHASIFADVQFERVALPPLQSAGSPAPALSFLAQASTPRSAVAKAASHAA